MSQIIIDKLGFLKYATEQDYCKRNHLPKNAFLDWLENETQTRMRLFLNTVKGKTWLEEHKDLIQKGYVEI